MSNLFDRLQRIERRIITWLRQTWVNAIRDDTQVLNKEDDVQVPFSPLAFQQLDAKRRTGYRNYIKARAKKCYDDTCKRVRAEAYMPVRLSDVADWTTESGGVAIHVKGCVVEYRMDLVSLPAHEREILVHLFLNEFVRRAREDGWVYATVGYTLVTPTKARVSRVMLFSEYILHQRGKTEIITVATHKLPDVIY